MWGGPVGNRLATSASLRDGRPALMWQESKCPPCEFKFNLMSESGLSQFSFPPTSGARRALGIGAAGVCERMVETHEP